MVVKNLNAREMEAYVSENVVARVFIGRQDTSKAQIRDHSNIARAYAALGQDGVEEVNALILHIAQDYGLCRYQYPLVRYNSAGVPIGYPNEPSILRGVAQRCGRAWRSSKRMACGASTPPHAGPNDPQIGQRTPPVAKGKQAKRQVLTRLLAEVGQLMVQTRLLVKRLGERRERVTHNAITTLTTMHEVAKRLMPQIVQWITTGVVAQGKNRACR